MIGVNILQGPQNWQIVQQTNGYARIELSGNIRLDETMRRDDLRIAVHVYDENTRNDVLPPVYVRPDGDDRWTARLDVPAGGMYSIATYLRWGERDTYRGDSIFHVGVGDVYVIAGQSNSFGTSKDNIEDKISEKVHVFRLNGRWDIASHPLHDTTGAVLEEFYNESAFHSPWLAFARQISESTGYPIGLIPTARGGTPLSWWDAAEDGRLLDAMLYMIRLSGGGVRGILWYQGCNDASEELSKTYLERSESVFADFKKKLNGEISILTVQLNKQTYIPWENARHYATVREAQRQIAKRMKNVYVVPALDLPVCDSIHNNAASNLVIARRTANIALKYIYRQSVVCDFPDISEAKRIADNTVRVYFDNVIDALTTDYVHAETSVFQIEDEEGTADLAEMKYNGDSTLDLVFERKIGKNARIGCTKFSDTGALPYDVATRLPVLAFCDVEIS